MVGQYLEYCENLRFLNDIRNTRFDISLSDSELLEKIGENTQKVREIRKKNNAILKSILYSKTASTLTESEFDDLEELAEVLFKHTLSLDLGVALEIRKLLSEYADLKNDRAMKIRQLYYLGLCLHYMNQYNASYSINILGDQVYKYFKEGSDYFKYWDELDRDSRDYVMRCMGNRKLGDPRSKAHNNPGEFYDLQDGFSAYMELFNETMEIFNNPEIRASQPDLPWETYIYGMYYDLTTYLTALRRHPDNTYIATEVMKAAQFVYKHQENLARLKDRSLGARAIYTYNAALYHSGQISAEKIIEELNKVYVATRKNDYSLDGITVHLRFPVYMKEYNRSLAELLPEKAEKWGKVISGYLEDGISYIQDAPKSEEGKDLARQISTLSLFMAYDTNMSITDVLDYLIAAHPETFIHSQMVAWLSTEIFLRMVKVSPQKLEGFMGLSAKEVVEKKDALAQRISYCALYHDIGKCSVLSELDIMGRSLTPYEMTTIQLHPIYGKKMLQEVKADEDMQQTALYHHLSYDQKNGYAVGGTKPDDKYKLMINIISVSDALDAGTDSIGRPYSSGKTVDTLVKELKEGAGTKYNPDVVALFANKSFFKEISKNLPVRREKVYCNVYRNF